jgi:hypothetical protein
MTRRNSSQSGLGGIFGRGVLGIMSIALTATISVIVQRSFDAMTRNSDSPLLPRVDLPAISLPSSQPNTAESEFEPGVDASVSVPSSVPAPHSFDGVGQSVEPALPNSPSVFEEEINSAESGEPTVLMEPDAEPEADGEPNSTSRVMRKFWEKLHNQ